jgi:hypothetical protein
MAVDIQTELGDAKKLAWHLRGLQPLDAIERLVANDGWVVSPVKSCYRNLATVACGKRLWLRIILLFDLKTVDEETTS